MFPKFCMILKQPNKILNVIDGIYGFENAEIGIWQSLNYDASLI